MIIGPYAHKMRQNYEQNYAAYAIFYYEY